MLVSRCSLKRKKHQRQVNQFVRELNHAIENDPLWKGRFYARQIQSSFFIYEDRSGGRLYFRLRFFDKQKMKYFDIPGWFEDGLFFRSKISKAMNEYIIHLSGVWDENPTYETTRDYRGRRINESFCMPYGPEDFDKLKNL